MNPQKLIPKPCHEDLNSMTGDQQRKFCTKCSTHVHDLTNYNEEEILALKVQNGGKLCGSFRIAKPVIKPLAVGAGIATLALASCNQDPEPLVGIICPPHEQETTESTSEPAPPCESVPAQGNQTQPPKNLILGKIAIPKQSNTPDQIQPSIKGEIIAPRQPQSPPVKEHEEEILLGDICIPEVTETNNST